jgi:hypothetical protein
MRHIHLEMPGGRGGNRARTAVRRPPEAIASYPDPECFGVDLPAAGLFARHVKGLTLHRFTVNCAKPDARPAAWLQDVIGGWITLRHLHNLAPPTIRAVAGVQTTVLKGGAKPQRLARGPRYLPVLSEDAHG